MTRIILLISVFLCSLSGFAQEKKMNRADFERLVDYANCKYAMAFMDAGDAPEAYKKNIRPTLEGAKLDKSSTILNYDNLRELLNGNSSALNLIETINKRKGYYDRNQTNVALIEELKASSWNSVSLAPTASTVLNQCYKKYKIVKDTSVQDIIQEQTLQTSAQVEELQSELMSLQNKYNELKNNSKQGEYQDALNQVKLIGWIALAGIALLFIVVFVLLFILKRKGSRDYIIEQVLDSDRVKKRFVSFTDFKKPQSTSGLKTKTLTEENVKAIVRTMLDQRSFDDRQASYKPSTETQSKQEEAEVSRRSQPSKYLKGKSGKVFRIVESSPENSFFRLINEEGDAAEFEFYGDETKAIAKRVFTEEIANIVSGSYDQAQRVQTSKPGRVRSLDGQWEVVEPIEIKLF